MTEAGEIRIDAAGERVRVRAGASPAEVRDDATRDGAALVGGMTYMITAIDGAEIVLVDSE